MDEHIKKVMVDLSLTTKESMHPLIKAAHYTKAKFALIEPPFVRAVELAKLRDRRVGEVLEEVHDMHTELFRQLLDLVFEMEPRNSNKLQANFRERSLKAFQEAGQGASNTAAVEKLFKENQEILKNWEEDRNAWNVEKNSLQKEVTALAEENQRYLDMILKNTKRRRLVTQARLRTRSSIRPRTRSS